MSVIGTGLENHKISVDETGNSTKTLLSSSTTFTGAWENVTNYTTVAVAIKGDNATDGTLYIESSQDGGTIVNSVPFTVSDASFDLPHIWNIVETHIRIRYTNGTTSQTGHFQLQTKYSNAQELGLLQNAGDTINANTDVQVTKSILTGETVDDALVDTGNYDNVRLLSNRALATGFPPTTLYQVKRPTDPAIPSGSSITVHATLNVEANVSDSGWLPVKSYGGGSLINMISDVNLDAYVLNASDTSGNNIQGNNFFGISVLAGSSATLGAAFFDDYFRIVVVNTSGSSADAYSIKAVGNQVPATPVFSSINQSVFGFFPAPLTRAVQVAEDPNGSFQNAPSSGVDNANSSITTLGISESFTGTYIDIAGYHGITVLVDGTSAGTADGTLFMEFSHDGVSTNRSIAIDVDDITSASPRTLGVVAKYFRIRYVNGTTATTSFDLQTMYHTQQISLVSRLDSSLEGNNDVTNVRSAIVSKKPDGTYVNDPHNGIAFTTAATLANDAVYTSPWVDTDGYNYVEIFFKTDEVSADAGIEVEFTDDLDTPASIFSRTFTFTANDVINGTLILTITPKLVGFRLVYTNGGTTQGSLLIQADVHTNGDVSRFNDGGGLITGDFNTEVALENIPNYIRRNTSGLVRLLDGADGDNTIWDLANDGFANRVARKTFKTTGAQIWIASDNSGDTSHDITIDYNDDANLIQTITVSLNGTTPVDTGVSGLDVFQAVLSSADDTLTGNVYIQHGNGFTSGVPDDGADVLAYISPTFAKTQHAVCRIPANKTMILDSLYLNITRTSGADGAAEVFARVKPSGGSWYILRSFLITTQSPINISGSIVLGAGDLLEFFVDNISDVDTNVDCSFGFTLVSV